MPPQPTKKAQPQKQAPQNPQGANKAQANPPQGQAAAAQQKPQRVIQGFDQRAFAKNLALEASQVIPANISEADKKFVVEIIHKFCLLCGDALVKDEKYNLNAQQASMITQFIGEWTFHKSIDLINGGIAPELREGVLQKVAFTVFEIAKQAISKNLPQEQTIQVIEIQVKNCFKQAIEDLKAKGRIDEKLAENTISQSSIDAMSQQQFEEEQGLGDDLSDAKILKLASLALLIKKLPKEKAEAIIAKFNQSEAQVLSQYVKMPNLEQKIDKGITIRCLNEIKEVLPEPKVISPDRIYAKLFKIVKTNDKNKISNIIDNERPLIKQFVLSPYTKDEVKIPTRVSNTILKYLEEKLSHHDN